MAHHIPEHKIIIVQTVIFIGLLVLLSFILEGCTGKQGTAEPLVKSSYYISATDPAGSLCEGDGNEGVTAVTTDDCISFSQPELYVANSAEKESFITGDSFEKEVSGL